MDDRLTTFLYLLLRDYVSFGEIEKILEGYETHHNFNLSETTLAEYARSIRDRIMQEPETHSDVTSLWKGKISERLFG